MVNVPEGGEAFPLHALKKLCNVRAQAEPIVRLQDECDAELSRPVFQPTQAFGDIIEDLGARPSSGKLPAECFDQRAIERCSKIERAGNLCFLVAPLSRIDTAQFAPAIDRNDQVSVIPGVIQAG